MGDLTDSTIPLSKSDVAALVEKRFGNLGGEAKELVLQLAFSPRRMRSFLSHLRLDPDRDLRGQLDVLFFYLVRQTDLRSFLVRARIEVAKDLREPTKSAYDALDIPTSNETPPKPLNLKPRAVTPPEASTNVTPLRTSVQPTPFPAAPTPSPNATPIPAPHAVEPIMAKPTVVAPPVQIPVASISLPGVIVPVVQISAINLEAEDSLDEVPARPWIESMEYTGPCRRMGAKCRRVMPERRARVDSVMGNRRFGGDRRKAPKGRRSSDNG